MTEEEFEAPIEKVARAILEDANSTTKSFAKAYSQARAAVAATGLKPVMVVVSADEIENLRPVVVTC